MVQHVCFGIGCNTVANKTLISTQRQGLYGENLLYGAYRVPRYP